MFTLATAIIQKTGLVGVALLMLLEVFVPAMPSELFMPMVGFEAATGRMDPLEAVFAGTLGSTLGGVLWYLIGWRIGVAGVKRWAGRDWRWLPLTVDEIDRAQQWFARWGGAAVCLGRMVPGFRGIICLPAGLARMPFARFLVFSSVGAFGWVLLMVAAGYALRAHYTQLQGWVDPAADLFMLGILVIYLIRVARYRPASADRQDPGRAA
jgi:membrane protein DedA with SNARE-associated domain